MSKNKILVIGHSVLDKIHSGDKTETKPGGIFFSTLGFIASEFKNEIYLLTSLTKENEKFFRSIYSQINLLPNYLTDKMPINHLYIYANKERDEVYEYIPEPLDIGRAGDLNTYDAIYLNMISGFDVTLETLTEIRKNYNGVIYIDIHTLSRGVFKNNKRIFRTIPDGIKWISNGDFVQVNNTELKMLSDELGESDIVREFFKSGGKGFIITESKNGAKGYFEKEGEIEFAQIRPPKVSEKECVGCGDYFGASFLSEYMHSGDFLSALNYATLKSSQFSAK